MLSGDVDHLNEMIISSEGNHSNPPSVDDENIHILQHQLNCLGFWTKSQWRNCQAVALSRIKAILLSFTVGSRRMAWIRGSVYFTILQEMVRVVTIFTLNAMTRAARLLSSRQIFVLSWIDITMHPGQALDIMM